MSSLCQNSHIPGQTLSGQWEGLDFEGFFLFNKQETLNKPGNSPFKFDMLASSRLPSFRLEVIGSEIKWVGS